jgi:excisionase family DNA binding protein
MIYKKDDKLLRPHIVAKMLDVSRDTVYRLIKIGELDSIRTSPHNIRVYKSSIDEYLKRMNPDMFFDSP